MATIPNTKEGNNHKKKNEAFTEATGKLLETKIPFIYTGI